MADTVAEEARALEQRLRKLAAEPDGELAERYVIRRSPRPKGIYWQLRGIASFIVSWFAARWPWQKSTWPVSLRQQSTEPQAKPLLIWAIGTDREVLREACTNLSEQWALFPGFAPVLITDVADFAFFSRLGWLVEFLPRLAGHGEPYDERKLKYLARLYRGAPVIPVRAGLEGIESVRKGFTASFSRARNRNAR